MRAGAGELRRDEDEQLVEQALTEKGRGDSRTALEEERLDALPGEGCSLRGERADSPRELRVVGKRGAIGAYCGRVMGRNILCRRRRAL